MGLMKGEEKCVHLLWLRYRTYASFSNTIEYRHGKGGISVSIWVREYLNGGSMNHTVSTLALAACEGVTQSI